MAYTITVPDNEWPAWQDAMRSYDDDIRAGRVTPGDYTLNGETIEVRALEVGNSHDPVTPWWKPEELEYRDPAEALEELRDTLHVTGLWERNLPGAPAGGHIYEHLKCDLLPVLLAELAAGMDLAW